MFAWESMRGGGLAGTAAWQEAVVVAMGDSSVGGLDSATNYIEDNGNRFLIVIFVTRVGKYGKGEKLLNKFWVIGLDLEVSR